MEVELSGSVKVTSMQQGHSSWKSGMVRLMYQDRKWRIAVRLHFQVRDRYTWELKDRVTMTCKESILINLVNDGDSIRIKDFDKGQGRRFVEMFNDIRNKKVIVEDKKPWQDVENRPHVATAKTTHKAVQSAPRVPLSPKQPHTTKSHPSVNPASSAARRNLGSAAFLNRGQSKSAEKMRPFPSSAASSFYGKNNENQRHYGALGVASSKIFRMHRSSVPRKKRPGMLPDPDRYVNAKRARNYDWGKKPTTPTKTELRGFSNLGNTCYMNAILQSLFHLPTFAADLRALFCKVGQNRAEYPENALFRALGSLLQAQRNDQSLERKRLCLGGIKNAISASAKRFSGYQQHDAHEFLGQMLDQLKDETILLNKASGQSSTDDDTKDNDPMTTAEGHNSSMEDTAQGPTYDNPTIRNFEFTVLHTIECQSCFEMVQKEETFHDLSLDIPRKARCSGERTLQHALDQFFEDEKIEYTCEKCGSTDSHVEHKFTRLPRIMIMHLKRYSILQQGSFCGKSGGSTAIPRYITLQDHCTQETSPPFPPDLNHSYGVASETKKYPDRLSDILDHGQDTPSRRKLDFQPTFKHVKPHIQMEAAGIIHRDDFTSDVRLSQEQLISTYQSSGEDTDGMDKVKTLNEDIDMLSDDGIPHCPINKDYEQRYRLAQVDGTMDPHDSEMSQGSLDEEEIKQLTEQEQLNLALSRSMNTAPKHSGSMKHTERHHPSSPLLDDPPSPELTYPTDDEDKPQFAMKKPRVHSKTHTKQCQSTNSDADAVFKDLNSRDSGIVTDASPLIEETRDAKQMGPGPKPVFPVFRNVLTPSRTKARRILHSTPNAGSEREIGAKTKAEHRSPTGKVEPINLEEFSNDMTEEQAKLEIERTLFDDSPVKASSDRESKPTLIIGSDDDDGLLFQSPVKGAKGNDKENVSPPHIVADTKEPEWIEKRREDREKEDREFQEAVERSIREQQADTEREDEELRRATELSLQEFNKDIFTVMDSDDEGSGSDGTALYSPGKLKELSDNFRSGELPYSYRLVSVVSHLGSSSSAGHYVCDALDIGKKSWSSYDDSHVSQTTELNVCTSRQQTGYVFFYCAKELIEELEEMYQNELHRTT